MKTIRIELKIDNYFDLTKTVYYSPYESQPSNPRMSSIMSAISATYTNFSGTDKVKIDDDTLPLLTLKVIQDTWFYRFIMDIPYNEDNYDIIKHKLNYIVRIILGQYQFIMFYTGMISYEITEVEDNNKDNILNKDYSRKVPTKSGDMKKFEYIISIDPKSEDKWLLQSIVDNNILNYNIVIGPKEYIISQYNTIEKLYEANGCYNLIISSDKTISQVNKCSSFIRFYPSRFGYCQYVSATITITNRYIDTDEKEKKKYKYTFFFNCYWTNESDFLERIIDRDLKEFCIEIGSDKKSFEITSDNTIKDLHKVGYLDTGYTIYAIDFVSEEDIELKYRTTSTISYLPSPVAVTEKESFTTSIARIEYVDEDEYKKEEENKVKIADYKPIVAYKLTLHPSAEYAIKLLKDAVSRGTNFSILRKDENIIINCNKDRILKPMYKKLDHSYELFIEADVILSDGSNNLNDMECSITLYNDNYAAIGYIKHILIDAEPIYDYVDIVSLDAKSGDHFSYNIHYDGNELYTFASDGSKIVLCSDRSAIDDISTKTIDNNTNNEEEKKDMATETVKSLSITFKGNANDTMISMNATKYNPKPGKIDKMIIKLVYDNVKSIIFHEPDTKIIWKDGTETTVSCRGNEKYDKEYGALFCVLKKLLGNTSNYYDLIKNLVKLGYKQEKIRAKVKADKEAKKLAKRRERQMKEAKERQMKEAKDEELDYISQLTDSDEFNVPPTAENSEVDNK